MKWLSLLGALLLTQSAFGHGFYVGIDYLLWYAHQDGLTFATRADTTYNSLSQFYTLEETDLFLKNRWDSGVRASLGFKPCNRSWDVRLIYSYFGTRIDPKNFTSTQLETITANANEYSGTLLIPAYFYLLIPEGYPAGSQGILTSNYTISPLWKLQFNEVDLELGSDFFSSNDAILRASIGARALFTNQFFKEKMVLTQVLTDASFSIPPTAAIGYLKQQNSFNGCGPRARIDLDYKIGYGLDVYGTFAATILWGYLNCHQTAFIPQVTNSLAIEESFTHSHPSTILSFDAALGLTWNYYMPSGSNVLTLKFGWEEHLYTGMNQLQQFVLNNTISSEVQETPTLSNTLNRDSRKDLSLSGFVFGISYSY